MKEIKGFKDDYSFLSNFAPCRIVLNNLVFKDVETAFQYMKTNDPQAKEQIFNSATPSIAKKLGRTCPLRPDWEEIKDSIMFSLVLLKFSQNTDAQNSLLNTDNAYLEETNHWGDRYWGVDGTGENKLGKILMSVRTVLEAAN